MSIQEQYTYKNITSSGTTVVKPNPGKLHSICINTKGATETAVIYDNTAASGTKIGTLSLNTEGTYLYDVMFNIGLTIVTSGTTAPDLTVCYA